MLKIYVRSGKDLSAVKSALRRSLRSIDGIDLRTFKGARGNALKKKVLDVVKNAKPFTLIILGKEDSSFVPYINTRYSAVIIVGKRRVRNARLHEIVEAVENGEAIIRNNIGWSEKLSNYVIGGGEDMGFPKDPATDPYLISDKALAILNKELGANISGSALMIRRLSGEHIIYVKNKPCFKILIRNEGYGIRVEYLTNGKRECMEGVSIREFAKVNREFIKEVEAECVRFIRKYASKSKLTVVPVSGGKDSSIALALAVKALGDDKVVAVYVDTGVDFTINATHAKHLAKLMGVRLITLKAPIRDYILSGLRSMPTHNNRWCAREKVKAIESFISKLKSGVGEDISVIIGTRDSESRQRFREAYVEIRDGVRYLRPIKNWSSVMCQAYLWLEGIPVNPLYKLGFYRIGCYLCPSIRSWEMTIIKEFSHIISNYVGDRDLFNEFLRVKAKNQKA